MLYIISLGLNDERDMSVKALEAARSCDKLYAEFYTTKTETTLEKLGKLIGKKVVEIKRSGLEEKAGSILEEAKKTDVGILVGGDALSATTHSALLAEARERGVGVKVIHGSSIFTAIAETGLMLYKFGRTVTLAYPQKNYSPTGFYGIMLENRKAGMHTLILLDVTEKPMTARKGIELLLEAEKKFRKKLVTDGTGIIAACKLGSDKNIIAYGKASELLKRADLDATPAVLVLPGELHFIEKEFLDTL